MQVVERLTSKWVIVVGWTSPAGNVTGLNCVAILHVEPQQSLLTISHNMMIAAARCNDSATLHLIPKPAGQTRAQEATAANHALRWQCTRVSTVHEDMRTFR